MTKRKVQPYLDLLESHRTEINNFPIVYAFNDEQLEEALKKLGAMKCECTSIFGHGDIVRKEDVKRFILMLSTHVKEIQELIKDPNIAEAAFRYEMDNHEYCINMDGDEDVLRCFGIDEEQLVEMGLQAAYLKARRSHMKAAGEDWGIV